MRFALRAAISLTVFIAFGCSDNRMYRDSALNLTVVRLDPELDNRWGTTGVVVQEAAPGTKLAAGDLLTHVVSRTTIGDQASLQAALKRAMGPRRHVWQIGAKETGDASAVLEIQRGGETLAVELGVQNLREWAKHGIRVEGNRVVDTRDGYEHPTTKSPAEASGVLVGDEITAVVDEDAVASPMEFRDALRRASSAAGLMLYTRELTGIRLEVVRTLGELGGENSRVRDRLIAIASASGDIAMRRTAMAALAVIAAKQTDGALLSAVLPMLDAAKEPDDEMRRKASEILETLVNSLPAELLDDTVLNTLVLALSDPLPGVQFKAGVMLSGLGERSFDALSAALSDANPERVRDIAATALGELGGARARDTLITTLRATPLVPLQLTVATALNKIGDAQSRAELQALLVRSTDSGVQEFVRQLLATQSAPVAAAP